MINLKRLKATLLTSGLQNQNQALFQVINQLIDALQEFINTTTASLGPGSGGSSVINNIVLQLLSDALSNSNEGNNNSIVIPGPVGPRGLDGIIGFPGLDGIDGDTIVIPGPPGINGTNGSIGRDGIGIPGQDGLDGDNSFISIPSNNGNEITITTTGNIDDLDFGNANVIRMNNASLSTIRGLKAGYPGQEVTIVSIGAGQVNLAHQNAGSIAENRLINFVTSDITPLAAGTGIATYKYNQTTARWKLSNHNQGALIAFTPTITFNNLSVSVTYTTQTGNYYIIGKLIYIDARIVLSNKGSSSGVAQFSAMPYSLSSLAATCVLDAFNLALITGAPYVIANGFNMSMAQTSAGGRSDLTDANITNTSDIRGGGVFAIS